MNYWDRSYSGGKAFNAWNTSQLGTPNTTLGNSNFGKITSASNSRSMQAALKYSF